MFREPHPVLSLWDFRKQESRRLVQYVTHVKRQLDEFKKNKLKIKFCIILLVKLATQFTLANYNPLGENCIGNMHFNYTMS